jgi:hypothetical protein
MASTVITQDPVADPARAPESAAALEPDPTPEPPATRVGWLQRFEESTSGRRILSSLIVLTLVAIVAINLPGSELRRQLLGPAQPYLNATGLDQNWAMFAPDPRRVVIDVFATITFADGKTARWSFPSDGALIGAYRDYRWRKWGENLTDPANAAALWRPAALWAAARETRPGHTVTGVSLVERYAALAPPGVQPSVGPTHQLLLYALRLPRRSGRQ